MKKHLIIAVSAIQLLTIQPVLAQMMDKDMTDSMSKQEQVMKGKCGCKGKVKSMKVKDDVAGCKGKMKSMNMKGKNGMMGGMMKAHMGGMFINTILKWTLMLFGIVALWKWIKKQK